MIRGNRAALCALAMVVGICQTVRAQDAVMVYVGDGLTMIIRQYDEDAGTAAGELRLKGQVYPFTARLQETDTGQNAQGHFVANGQRIAFQVRENADTETLVFTTGNQTFRLKEVDEIPPAPAPQPPQQPVPPPPAPQPPAPQPPQPTEPANPLEGVQPTPAQPANPLDGVPPAQPATPAQPPANNPLDSVAPAPGNPASKAQRPDRARFTLHKFPDVSMGNVASHTVLLPEGWTAEGRTEWSQGDVPWPQNMFTINSPEKGKYSTHPAHHSLYWEMHPQPGLATLPPGGEKPPKDPTEWVIKRLGNAVQNLKIVSATRDPKLEALSNQSAKQNNTNTMGAEMQEWIIHYEFDQQGTRRREELRLTYSCTKPIDNGNMNTWYWSVFPHFSLGAPVDKFEQLRPGLLAVGATIRPTAKWWVQSQALLAELSRQRIANFARVIAERAKQYDQISKDQMTAFRQRMKSMDKMQHEFTNNYLYERDDYTDTDGSIVNLPMHFSHVFSNGQGGYLLTNNSLDKPGEAWQEIPAAPGLAGGG